MYQTVLASFRTAILLLISVAPAGNIGSCSCGILTLLPSLPSAPQICFRMFGNSLAANPQLLSTKPKGLNYIWIKRSGYRIIDVVFSTTMEYAFRAVTFLASRPGPGLTAQRIAEGARMPEDYLSKVLQQLVRGGILTSQRGRGGGFQLARPASQISMLTVVNAVEPIVRIDKCPLGLPEHAARLCPLHRRLDHAYGLVEKAFANTTLAELVEEPLINVA